MLNDGAFRDVVMWLIHRIGYTNTVKLKDLILSLNIMLTTVLVMLLLFGRVLHRIRHSDEIGKLTSTRFKDGKNTHYITHVHSFHESLEFIVLMFIIPFTQKTEYTVGDNRRAKIFLTVLIALVILSTFISGAFITHPLINTFTSPTIKP